MLHQIAEGNTPGFVNCGSATRERNVFEMRGTFEIVVIG